MRTKSQVSEEESTKCCTSSKVLCSDQTFHFLFILTKSSCKVWNTLRARQFPPQTIMSFRKLVLRRDVIIGGVNYRQRSECHTYGLVIVVCVTQHCHCRRFCDCKCCVRVNNCPQGTLSIRMQRYSAQELNASLENSCALSRNICGVFLIKTSTSYMCVVVCVTHISVMCTTF